MVSNYNIVRLIPFHKLSEELLTFIKLIGTDKLLTNLVATSCFSLIFFFYLNQIKIQIIEIKICPIIKNKSLQENFK